MKRKILQNKDIAEVKKTYQLFRNVKNARDYHAPKLLKKSFRESKDIRPRCRKESLISRI